MTSKRYGLSGISSSVELGKNGLKLVNNGSQVELRSNDGLSLVELRVADGTVNNAVVTKSQLDEKQGSLSIAAGSQNYLELQGDVLSVKNLLIHDVAVDNVHLDLASYLAVNYTVGNELQQGDIVILMNATDSQRRSYIHNGGGAGDATDFTRLQVDLSESVIRAMFSAGTGISYNPATGEIAVDATAAEISSDPTGLVLVTGNTAQAMFASIDSVLDSFNNRISSLEATVASFEPNNLTHFRKVAFDYQSGATFNIGALVPAGSLIKKVAIGVETAFDDVAANIQIGTAADPDMLMSIPQNELQATDTYIIDNLKALASDAQLIATMSAGISTQGAGNILIEFC